MHYDLTRHYWHMCVNYASFALYLAPDIVVGP